MHAVIDGEGPWPSLSPKSNGTFVPFDVDKYDGLAVVIGDGRNRKGREVSVRTSSSRTTQEHGSTCPAAGVGGRRRNAGTSPPPERPFISGWEARPGSRRSMRDARLLCGVPVWTSGHDRRSRPSGTGPGSPMSAQRPGWLAVLWTPDDPATVPPTVTAAARTFLWTAPNDAASGRDRAASYLGTQHVELKDSRARTGRSRVRSAIGPPPGFASTVPGRGSRRGRREQAVAGDDVAEVCSTLRVRGSGWRGRTGHRPGPRRTSQITPVMSSPARWTRRGLAGRRG